MKNKLVTTLNTKPKSYFSARIYSNSLIFLAILGILVSFYLILTHYKNYTDIGYQSFCAISNSLNCDTVAQSPYSIFLKVPVALWGILGYLFFILISVQLKPRQNYSAGFSILFLVAFFYSVLSIVLALVSSLYIHSYCIMCILTYGINFTLLLLSWMAHSRFGGGSFSLDLKESMTIFVDNLGSTTFILTFGVLFIVTSIIFYPQYWEMEEISSDTTLNYGITTKGNPWVGAEKPILTIVEFSDYMCFQCGKMHQHLRELVNKFPDKIRLIHRQFPLDQAVNPMVTEQTHPNSGLISLFALYALQSDLFWQVNDRLFREARGKKINISNIAENTGLDLTNIKTMLNNATLHSKLSEDIRDGISLGITATPSYLIDGEVFSGSIPESIFTPILQDQ